MRVLVREPNNQPLQLKEIEGTFEDFQELVGESIEIVPITEDIVCICNEKGESQGLEKNFYDNQLGWVLGACVFTATQNAEFTSLSDSQMDFVAKYIGFPII